MSACFRTQKMKKIRGDDEVVFKKNGSMLLEAAVAFCNGKCNPIRSFTAKELKRITNDYSRLSLYWASNCISYKGFLQGRPVSVTRHRQAWVCHKTEGEYGVHQLVINSIVIASRMSIHKNVLKLIGCCLETKFPIAVHEFAENGSLEDRIRCSDRVNSQPLAWKCRLNIAIDVATVVAYLHIAAFSRPVVHRDVRPAVILLDKHNVAKLSDFSLCISIPEGESDVEDVVRGRMGFGAPEYVRTGRITEKVDVYAFGMLLLFLLTGQRQTRPFIIEQQGEDLNVDYLIHSESDNPNIESNRLRKVVDPSLLEEEVRLGKDLHFLNFAAVIHRCTRMNKEDRPTMIEVAEQLRQIELSASS